MLDPGYLFNPQVHFEDEFVSALKCSTHYLFIGQVDPKWLTSPANMCLWPSLLGVLHWLVCVCKVRRGSSVRFKGLPFHHPYREGWRTWTVGTLHYNHSREIRSS